MRLPLIVTFRRDALDECPLPKVAEKRIRTYFEVVSYLLKFYAETSNIAKVVSKILAFRMTAANEILEQFIDLLRTKVAQCNHAYP